jgi:hypothetical protein
MSVITVNDSEATRLHRDREHWCYNAARPYLYAAVDDHQPEVVQAVEESLAAANAPAIAKAR